MASGDISKKMYQVIADKIGNQGYNVESATGLIWRELDNASRHFIDVLGISKVSYELDLVPGKTSYPLDNWIVKIEDYSVRRGNNIDNHEIPYFRFRLPKTTNADKRYITITDPDNEIASGDVLILYAEIATPDDFQIDEDNDPRIEKRYHRLLEDYAVAEWLKGEVKQKGGGFIPMKDVKRQQIDAVVLQIAERVYALNRSGTIKINQLNF